MSPGRAARPVTVWGLVQAGSLPHVWRVNEHAPAASFRDRAQRELSGRAYARLSALAGTVPARLVVFAREHEWLVQAERIEGRWYVPLANAVLVKHTDAAAAGNAIKAVLTSSRSGVGVDEPATPERRSFHGGTITPPVPGWSSAVALAFAPDAIDVWPLKPSGTAAFAHDGYPVAVLAPDIHQAELTSAMSRMLAWFKPRRS